MEKYYSKYLATLAKQLHLLKTPLSTIIGEKKEAITVPHTTSQKEVLELLAKNKYLAVPVKDKDSVIGIATLGDIFSLLFLEKGTLAKGDKITKEELTAAWAQNETQNIDATIFSRENVDILIFDERETLSKVLESFSQGYHRIIVTSAFSPSLRLLTQTDVICYLHSTIDKLGSCTKLQASDIVGCEGKVVTISSTQTALSAFRTLATRTLAAAPIVDSSGVVIGSLSLSNLRGLTSEGVPDLLLPVNEFLKTVHGGEVPKSVTIKKSDQLSDIIPLIAKARIHRAWIVSDDGKPLGVLALTDIIRAVFLEKLSTE